MTAREPPWPPPPTEHIVGDELKDLASALHRLRAAHRELMKDVTRGDREAISRQVDEARQALQVVACSGAMGAHERAAQRSKLSARDAAKLARLCEEYGKAALLCDSDNTGPCCTARRRAQSELIQFIELLEGGAIT